MPALSPPIRVLIVGSCVSRDVLAHQPDDSALVLADYYARSSLASLACAPFTAQVALDHIGSAFQRRMVERDLRKTLLDSLDPDAFDVLLLDLIDERLHLCVSHDGSVCTLSNELVSSGFRCDPSIGIQVRSGSDEFWRRWEHGWTVFAGRLAARGLLGRVRVNQVYWSRQTESGADFLPHYTAHHIQAANALLERMYTRIAADLPASQFMRFDARLLTGAAHHRWGPSPFHYVEAYYREAARLLTVVQAESAGPNAHATAGAPTGTTDYARFREPVHDCADLESVLSHGLRDDGIYRIGCEQGSLDVLLKDLHKLESVPRNRVLLVGFSGAVSNRAGKHAPFFSGLELARTLQLPLVSISDPTLALDADIPLGWYAGNHRIRDLPRHIARLLDMLAAQHSARLVLFGGSGGGFAVLAQLALVQSPATGFVWNPQTSIAGYAPEFVRQYLSVAFPHLQDEAQRTRELPEPQQRVALRALLETTGVRHDLATGCDARPQDLLYLQNRSDWHVASHARPFLQLRRWTRLSPGAFAERGSAAACWFGNWGQGHAAPPKELIRDVLALLASGTQVSEVARSLDAQAGRSEPFQWLDAESIDAPFALDVAVCGQRVQARCRAADGLRADGLHYAFYLLANGTRCDARWYQPEAEAVFDLPASDTNGGMAVMAFIRDSLGVIRTIQAPVPPATDTPCALSASAC